MSLDSSTRSNRDALRRAVAGLGAFLLSGCAQSRTEAVPASVTAGAATPAAEDEPEPGLTGEEGDDPPLRPAGPPAPAGAAEKALLGEVDRELAAVKSSVYSHHSHVDEASGTFEYDCSGFLDYALSRVAPDALAAVQAVAPRRPRSSDYVTFLETLAPGAVSGRWQRVGRVQDLLPGDVVVWLRPADSRSTNTGHTMIVHGPVTPDPDQAGAFVVPVADSTGRLHLPGDSRAEAHATGLGRGEIVLIADGAGAPVRFRWSRGRKSREKSTTIALGRLR